MLQYVASSYLFPPQHWPIIVMEERLKAVPGISMTVSMFPNTAKAAMVAVPKPAMVEDIMSFPIWNKDYSMATGIAWSRIKEQHFQSKSNLNGSGR